MIVIPAIDLLGGRVVRLAQGDFARVTDFGDDPVALAQRYEAAGARWLHVVNLDGARDGGGGLANEVAAITAATTLHIQAGGGVRRREDVEAVLGAGAARVVVGTTALRNRTAVAGWLARFGADAVVVALDVRVLADGVPYPAIEGWARTVGTDLWDTLDAYAETGLRHVLCTDVARDGMGTGPNTALYRELQRRYPYLSVQASGGVGSADDLAALRDAGISAAICGRALLDGRLSPDAVFA